jgi:hypothetical protein
MAFFENLSETLSSKGKEAAEAAKRLAEVANLKNQINGIEAEIKKQYRKIGEDYYEAYKDAEVTCEFEESVQTIRDAKKTAAELRKKVRELKGDIECPNCGSQIPADSAFCPQCGAKVEIEYYDEADTDADEYTEDLIVPEEEAEEAAATAAEEVTAAAEEAAATAE